MKVVHFSTTPLAGGPMRMVKALNKYTNVEARLIELQRNHVYDHDLILSESLDECMDVVSQADVINFHNYLDLDSKEFSPIDFNALKKEGKAFIIYYRTDPHFISGVTKKTVQQVLDNPMPAIVNGQYPERYFDKARVVRNVMPDMVMDNESIYDVVNVSSKSKISARQSRWGTKGYPEFMKIVKNSGLSKEFDIIDKAGIPYLQNMKFKSQGKLVLDDMVTGSYHMAGIEGLMLGKVTLAYLDKRIERVIKSITGSSEIPFVNTHLIDLPTTVRRLLNLEPQKFDEMGSKSRDWFEKYWNEKDIADDYESIYQALVQNPEHIKKQPELSSELIDEEYSIGYLDKVHKTRTSRLPMTKEAVRFLAKQAIKKVIGR